MADTIETLGLRAQLVRTQMEALQLRAQLMQRDHQALAAELGQINAQQQALAAAEAAAKASTVDAETQAKLDLIATLPMDKLPSYVTRQAQNDDGSPKRDAAGRVILLHQDGTPLSVIERAIIARQAELRAASGG
jgi:hypothetical protein